jgi:hypothetical protein
MQFKGVTLTVNYPDDSAEAAIPSAMTLEQMIEFLRKLCASEPEMTSFALVAAKA